MTAKELRQKYLDFFESRGHAIVPSASLIPENDPTTLFTGSGMQPMVPYLLGEKHPLGTRITDSQKSFRTQDIEEVGDNRHTTVFEMLGNWSLGDYFKKEQINWMFEFLTNELKLDPDRIYVTVFRGNEKIGIPRDDESVKIWQEVFKKSGIEARPIDFSERDGMQGGRIFYYDETKNWWSRAGVPANMPVGEPGGPDSEMFWDFGVEHKFHENSKWKDEPCHINCDCGRFLEIGNNVFMEYVKTEKGFELLKQKNVDYGGGLERQIAAKLDTPDIFLTDIFTQAIKTIEKLSGKTYSGNEEAFRVILDHLRASTLLIGDGAYPSNKDQGYFVRRLIRRAVRFAHKLGIENNFCSQIAKVYIEYYKDPYISLENDKEKIFNELENEENKFRKTLKKGESMIIKLEAHDVTGEAAFDLYQTYGYPIEMVEEAAKERGLNIADNFKNVFQQELQKHQDLSRTASEGKFKGGLADHSERTTQLHTTAHLMLAGLRKVLGDHIHQKGSNINGERIRFDFSHGEKMTDEQKKAVEEFVNTAIKAAVPVTLEEMSLEEAREAGAEGAFEDKYGDRVKVYTIVGFSKEICGGPHVENTGDIKGVFKITKEESSSAGVRRIKAVVE
ncbi:MAG: alanine--tRNA ligase [Parcubacteria group bacterium]|jgi:alanyl-tRNA synthetase